MKHKMLLPLSLSRYDKKHLSFSERRQIKKLKRDFFSGNPGAHTDAQMIRKGHGYSGGWDGSGYFPVEGGNR